MSLQPLQSFSDMGIEPGRISFSSDFLDESNFISICPNPQAERDAERARETRNFISICPNPRVELEAERARETRNFISIWPNPRAERARETHNFVSICPNTRAERETERARETRNFISICPNPRAEREAERGRAAHHTNFEFLSGNVRSSMMSADELFLGGKLLPSWQTHHADKLNRISLKPKSNDMEPKKIERIGKIEDSRINWFLDDDPSPRPPKCTLLWKELLKLKKQRPPSTLSSSYVSSSSPSSSSRTSLSNMSFANEGESGRNKEREKSEKKMKKGQERTKSTSTRIRPILNVRMCSQAKNNVLQPPLFSLRKGRYLDQVKYN